jgi:hypothetical protein
MWFLLVKLAATLAGARHSLVEYVSLKALYSNCKHSG